MPTLTYISPILSGNSGNATSRFNMTRTWLCMIALMYAVESLQVPRIRRVSSHDVAKMTISTPTKLEKSVDVEKLMDLNQCESGTAARAVLESSLDVDGSLYGSIRMIVGASAQGISDADLAIQTKVRGGRYSVMELIELNGDKDADRASLSLVGVMVASIASALVANQNLPGPEIVRFVVVWALSFAPLAFVGTGIATPEKLQSFLIAVQREIFPVYRKRMIQHEAAHFLIGYLLGVPIKGYSANAVKNAVEFFPLSDPDVGRNRARDLGFDQPRNSAQESLETVPTASSNAPYFSQDGRGSNVVAEQSVFRNAKNYTDNPFLKLDRLNEPTTAWPFRGFDESTIDTLTAISVAGVCGEILAFGNAEGGFADLSQLRQIFSSAQSEISEREMENRIRYSLGYTMSQLRLHLGALDALAEAMEESKSVADCVLAIEQCQCVSGDDGFGDYDRRRRDAFRNEGTLERFLLGDKNTDTEETRLIAGIGGGSKQQRFVITGDDPFYLSLGVAILFLAWASSGGLSLH